MIVIQLDLLSAPMASKRLDVGSLIAHALGHTLALHHPHSIDESVYFNTTSFSADQAACNESTSRWTHRDATMCNKIDDTTTAHHLSHR